MVDSGGMPYSIHAGKRVCHGGVSFRSGFIQSISPIPTAAMTHRRIRTVFFPHLYDTPLDLYIENRKLGPWALPRSEAYGRKAVSRRYRAFDFPCSRVAFCRHIRSHSYYQNHLRPISSASSWQTCSPRSPPPQMVSSHSASLVNSAPGLSPCFSPSRSRSSASIAFPVVYSAK